MRVERRPMSSTVPMVSPTRHRSPTLITRSLRMLRPPKRFSIVFCAASASAMPPMPSVASAAERFTPAMLRMPNTAAVAMHTFRMRCSRRVKDSVPRSTGAVSRRRMRLVHRVIRSHSSHATAYTSAVSSTLKYVSRKSSGTVSRPSMPKACAAAVANSSTGPRMLVHTSLSAARWLKRPSSHTGARNRVTTAYPASSASGISSTKAIHTQIGMFRKVWRMKKCGSRDSSSCERTSLARSAVLPRVLQLISQMCPLFPSGTRTTSSGNACPFTSKSPTRS